jgi:hypothetical protein
MIKFIFFSLQDTGGLRSIAASYTSVGYTSSGIHGQHTSVAFQPRKPGRPDPPDPVFPAHQFALLPSDVEKKQAREAVR